MDILKDDKNKVMCNFLLELLILGEPKSGYIDHLMIARARAEGLVFFSDSKLTPNGHAFLKERK